MTALLILLLLQLHSGPDTTKLNKLLDAYESSNTYQGIQLFISSSNGDWTWKGSRGNIAEEDAFFVASVTKLYVAALVFQLQHEGVLTLDDPIEKHLPLDVYKGLNVQKGVDISAGITIRQLLSHTSGIPDYFEQKQPDGTVLFKEALRGNDKEISFEEMMAITRSLKAPFSPGKKGKAHYSDSNYQLLAKIAEVKTGKSLRQLYHERIFNPLGLNKTYAFSDVDDDSMVPLLYKKEQLHIPYTMKSFAADGGIVSTSEELMVFIKAYMLGRLFPKEYLAEQQWNGIFFPLEAGTGLIRFKLSRWMSPFSASPELIGHSGSNGAFAFFCPDKQVFLVGTTNQLSAPGAPFRLMIRALKAL